MNLFWRARLEGTVSHMGMHTWPIADHKESNLAHDGQWLANGWWHRTVFNTSFFARWNVKGALYGVSIPCFSDPHPHSGRKSAARQVWVTASAPLCINLHSYVNVKRCLACVCVCACVCLWWWWWWGPFLLFLGLGPRIYQPRCSKGYVAMPPPYFNGKGFAASCLLYLETPLQKNHIAMSLAHLAKNFGWMDVSHCDHRALLVLIN